MSATGTGSVLFALVLLLTLCSLRATPLDCSGPCRCVLEEIPTCPVGVTLVKDGCGCCPVCAKQLGDVCTKRDVCDKRKDLYCSFELPTEPNIGVCRAKEGASCYIEGTEHKDGETFQKSCTEMCTCRSGKVSCESLCPPSIYKPTLECPFPRSVRIPGTCCEEWVCDKLKNHTRNHSATTEAVTTEPTTLPPNCKVKTTKWSACSKTCGVGISTRHTNANAECVEQWQSRLCFLRPCDADLETKIKKGKRCLRASNMTYPIRLKVDECISVNRFNVKICGVCIDGGCCTPKHTTTERVKFRCPDDEFTEKNVMFIQACRCHYRCPVESDSIESTY